MGPTQLRRHPRQLNERVACPLNAARIVVEKDAAALASIGASSPPNRACVVSPNMVPPLRPPSGVDVGPSLKLERQVLLDASAIHAAGFDLAAWGSDFTNGKLDVELANPPCPGTRTLQDSEVRSAQVYFDRHYGRGRILVWSRYEPYPRAD